MVHCIKFSMLDIYVQYTYFSFLPPPLDVLGLYNLLVPGMDIAVKSRSRTGCRLMLVIVLGRVPVGLVQPMPAVTVSAAVEGMGGRGRL